jgi:hypothetical protein
MWEEHRKSLTCPICNQPMMYDGCHYSHSIDDEIGRSTSYLYDLYACPNRHSASDWLDDEGSDFYQGAAYTGEIQFHNSGLNLHSIVKYDVRNWRVEHPEWVARK